MNIKKKLNCILLIDDDEATNFLHSRLLRKAQVGHHIQVCEGGKEALEYLSQESKFSNSSMKSSLPDLIFLDVNMPRMNGWEFLEAYHQLEIGQRADIPIVMLSTTLSDQDQEKACRQTGVVGFINKPLNPVYLQSLLQNVFQPYFSVES